MPTCEQDASRRAKLAELGFQRGGILRGKLATDGQIY
jgi:hypothetical protein